MKQKHPLVKSKIMLVVRHDWQLNIISCATAIGTKRFKGRQKNWLNVLDRYNRVCKIYKYKISEYLLG